MPVITDEKKIQKIVDDQDAEKPSQKYGDYNPFNCDPVVYFRIRLKGGHKTAKQCFEIIDDVWSEQFVGSVKHNHGIKLRGNLAIQPIKGDSATGQAVQKLGMEHGCWTCGKKMTDDGAANWVADHIPPVKMTQKALDAVNAEFGKTFTKGSYFLYPSCYDCCRLQPAVLAKVNAKPENVDTILARDKQRRMIIGGIKKTMVQTSKTTTYDAKDVWKDLAGIRCHICGVMAPSGEKTPYIADHYPAREFNTVYATTLFAMIGRDVKVPEARPQCITCSNRQGDLSSVSKKLLAVSRALGFPRYKL